MGNNGTRIFRVGPPTFELLNKRIVSGLEGTCFLMEKKSMKMQEFNEPCKVFK